MGLRKTDNRKSTSDGSGMTRAVNRRYTKTEDRRRGVVAVAVVAAVGGGKKEESKVVRW